MPKLDINATAQRTENLQGLGQRQAVGEHQGFAHRLDTQLVVVSDGFFRPLHRVTGVVAQAVEQLGEVQVEVAEERVGGDAIGQGDAQQATVFAAPSNRGRRSGCRSGAAQLLVGHDPFVGHGAQRLHVQLAGQVHVAGANEAPGEVMLEHD